MYVYPYPCVYIELLSIDHICLYCQTAHVDFIFPMSFACNTKRASSKNMASSLYEAWVRRSRLLNNGASFPKSTLRTGVDFHGQDPGYAGSPGIPISSAQTKEKKTISGKRFPTVLFTQEPETACWLFWVTSVLCHDQRVCLCSWGQIESAPEPLSFPRICAWRKCISSNLT